MFVRVNIPIISLQKECTEAPDCNSRHLLTVNSRDSMVLFSDIELPLTTCLQAAQVAGLAAKSGNIFNHHSHQE